MNSIIIDNVEYMPIVTVDKNGVVDLDNNGNPVANIKICDSNTGAFIPSSYDADLTMNGVGQPVALATGTTKVKVVNQGGATESIRFAFGTSSADAIANLTISESFATTGDYIPAIADAPPPPPYGVPANATHYAVANAVLGDVQVVSITQGVSL